MSCPTESSQSAKWGCRFRGSKMISESSHWKKPLLQTSKRLRSLALAQRISDRQLAQVERDIFVSFYSIRKLFETQTRITNRTQNVVIKLYWFRNIRPVRYFGVHKIDVHFDLEKKHEEVRDVVFIANQIIHSYVFLPYESEGGGFGGIYFNSDKDKNKKLYSLDVESMVAIFDRVGNDEVKELEWHLDPATGEEIIRTN